jgi:hypothetical protein
MVWPVLVQANTEQTLRLTSLNPLRFAQDDQSARLKKPNSIEILVALAVPLLAWKLVP